MYHDRVDKMAFNKQNLNAYQVALTSEQLSDKKVKENFTLFHGIFFPTETMRTLYLSSLSNIAYLFLIYIY